MFNCNISYLRIFLRNIIFNVIISCSDINIVHLFRYAANIQAILFYSPRGEKMTPVSVKWWDNISRLSRTSDKNICAAFITLLDEVLKDPRPFVAASWDWFLVASRAAVSRIANFAAGASTRRGRSLRSSLPSEVVWFFNYQRCEERGEK